MKLIETLSLQEGDLVDVHTPAWQGGDRFGKVLLVSSKGGIYVGKEWCHPPGGPYVSSRWAQYHHVKPLGRREPLTEKERAVQLTEIEKVQKLSSQLSR
jgi:hypothetical protein